MVGPDEPGAPSDVDAGVVRFDWIDVDDSCLEIVRTVAAVTGPDVIELPPLEDVVDADALETLAMEDSASNLRLSFTYAETSVVVGPGDAIGVRLASA